MELSLKQRILNEIDSHPRGYVGELAEITNYSSGSALKKILTDRDREFDKFNSLVKLVKHLFGHDEQKLMAQYSKEIDPKNKTARTMLEYLSSNRLLDEMKLLIDKMKKSNNKDSREFAEAYAIQYEWQSNYYTLDTMVFMNKINEIKTNIIELKVFLNLLKLYAFYRQENYKMSYEISKFLIFEIDNIKDQYIKMSYKTKLNEALSYIELRVLDNPEKSRKYSQEVLNSDAGLMFKSYAYYSIGCSYLFTSYDKALYNLSESIKLYETVNRKDVVKDVREKIELLNVIWNKESEFYSVNTKLLFEAKIQRLSVENLEKFKDTISQPFYLLIKGILKNNNDLLLQSLIEFLKIGDTFLGNIPKLELLKNGYNQDVLNALISINCA